MTAGIDLLIATIKEGGHSGIAKLKREFFIEEEFAAFDFVEKYYTSYGELPSLDILCKNTYIPPIIDNIPGQSWNFQYWYDKVINRLKFNISVEHIEKIEEALKQRNVDKCSSLIEDLSSSFRNLSINKDTYDAQSFINLSYDNYIQNKKLKEHGVLNSIKSGWGPLDKTVHGYRAGDLVVFAGRRGVGKSYILSKQALNAMIGYKLSDINIKRHRVMYVSMEMTAQQVADRFIAMQLQFDPEKVITASLSREDEERFESTREEYNQYPLKVIEGGFDKTVTDIVAEVKEYRPDIVFIDGSYLLKSENKKFSQNWEKQADIHQDLKTRVAMGCGIPVICTVQQNRASKGIKDGDGIVAGSDVIEQLASVLISVKKIDHQPYKRIMNIVKNRDGAEDIFVINFIFSRLNLEVHEEETRKQRDRMNGIENRNHEEQLKTMVEDMKK